MKWNQLLIGAIVLVVLTAGVLVASPWWSLSGLAQAFNAGDRQRLARYVDFPRLRESLREQVTSQLSRKIEEESGDSPDGSLGALIGTALGGAVVGKLLDTVVTPEGVAELVKRRTGIEPDPKKTSTRFELVPKLNERVDLDWIDTHSIRATIYDKESKVLTHALLERDGLTWRVVDVDLPDFDK